MEILQRLQLLDVLFAILWASIIAWSVRAGLIRQLGMLVAVYTAAIAAGTLYRPVGEATAEAFGRENLPVLQFAVYVILFAVAVALIAFAIWRTYPAARLGRSFGWDNVLGIGVSVVWGTLFLIAVVTILRFYAAVPWREQEASQSRALGQVMLSQSAPMLEVVASPLWTAMAAWFPAPVSPML